ncbi:MAG TPA: GntR family transcriptional regulator [Dehalococcoidia bacterium]|nr:GntR family transcriptional regulator [Dehalococcoidia bacterium]
MSSNTELSRAAGRGNETPAEQGLIYQAIRRAILDGRYGPGERLVESQLATTFGVSRTRVREALSRLEAERLVAPRATRGHVVRELGRRDMEELYALRLELEGYAARTAAETITLPDLDDLRAIHERMAAIEREETDGSKAARLEKIRKVTDANNEFHRLIQQASRNRRLEAVLRTVVERPLVFQSFYWYSDRELAESLAEHERIMQALADRDGALAERLIKQHISRGLRTLLREMAPNE